MPAALTHRIHAEKVLKLIKPKEIDETAYFWGCQGPDFLFTHRFLPWMKGTKLQYLGTALHCADPNLTLKAMIDYVYKNGTVVAASYLLGFICHYSLDSTAHPYINFLAAELYEDEPQQTTSIFHGEIESALDTIVLRAEKGDLPSEHGLGKCFPKNETVQHATAALYRHVIAAVLHEDIEEELLYQATRDAHLVFSLLTDRTGLKRAFFLKLEQGKPHTLSCQFRPLTERADVDYSNLSESLWLDRAKVERTDSFFSLLELAKKKAVGIIDGFQKQNIEELTKNEPFA